MKTYYISRHCLKLAPTRRLNLPVSNFMCKKTENKMSKYLEERNMKLKPKKKKGVVKGFEKLFKDKTITNDDITEAVSKILDLAKNDVSSDFNRLVAFLIATCEESLTGDRDRSHRKRSRDESQDEQSVVLYHRQALESELH